MKFSKDRVYYMYDNKKIKRFIITDLQDGVIIKGYIEGENKIHNRNISWLQESPVKLKKKYQGAMKYYKKFGNKNIGILKDDFPTFDTNRIIRLLGWGNNYDYFKKEVLVIDIERNFNGDSSRSMVTFIDSKGIVRSCDKDWFVNLK